MIGNIVSSGHGTGAAKALAEYRANGSFEWMEGNLRKFHNTTVPWKLFKSVGGEALAAAFCADGIPNATVSECPETDTDTFFSLYPTVIAAIPREGGVL
jgi:hypothetical protein